METLLPPLRLWHRAQYQRHFEKVYAWERLFQGVYPSFEEALAHIPTGRLVGYDNPESAAFLSRSSPMLPSEYPILFWLSRLFAAGHSTVFDFGGYLALSYRWYRPYSLYPQNLRWTICDVPAVVAAGKRLLAQEPDSALRYTTAFTEASDASILLASGALHFCDEELATMLQTLPALPAHLLVNKLPTTPRATFFTLQNMGPAIAPYRIANRTEFIASLEALDYELVDAWQNPELSAFIPFHPQHSVPAFDGFYLRHKSASAKSHPSPAGETR